MQCKNLELKINFMDESNQDISVNETPPLSKRLLTWRSSVHLSTEEIAIQTHIKPEVVLALEQGDYDAFPAHVYAAGYLRRMIEHFSIPEGDSLLDALKGEWQEKHPDFLLFAYALPTSRHQIWYITPRRLLAVAGGTALLFFAWFFIVQIVGFTGVPGLRIDEPPPRVVIETPIIRVRGTTEKESQLTVNGREITMNGNGAFDQEIELASGLNTLRFLTQNRFGKIAEETKYVVVK